MVRSSYPTVRSIPLWMLLNRFVDSIDAAAFRAAASQRLSLLQISINSSMCNLGARLLASRELLGSPRSGV